MARDYIMINNYSRLGTMGISRHALEAIASNAVNNVRGAQVSSRKALFSVDNGVKVSFDTAGKAIVKVDVIISPNAQVTKVCREIQEEVANEISMMCDTVPYDVKINVKRIG
ncbi:MAG: Asp23/Gls24 family envelope stress response protein [Bacilli bacterium]|nr:Asp23/Gls24 family envelope stress response protein [Bacilli bacterium]